MTKTFGETLGELRYGAASDEITVALGELVGAVQETGRGGTLTLTLSVKPQSKGAENIITIADTIAVKMPKVDKGETIMFVSADGSLTRNDPRQMNMELKTAGTQPAAATVLKDADSGGGSALKVVGGTGTEPAPALKVAS